MNEASKFARGLMLLMILISVGGFFTWGFDRTFLEGQMLATQVFLVMLIVSHLDRNEEE
jgi:hypothetical protein